ncbi:MAG TPA: hypoxanthine phosphoribosyltransferase [Dehalococcoidia bacterium]|nr:hypoxanthine phosphoribosyltransferase [Dehalococcoidia bacterium]
MQNWQEQESAPSPEPAKPPRKRRPRKASDASPETPQTEAQSPLAVDPSTDEEKRPTRTQRRRAQRRRAAAARRGEDTAIIAFPAVSQVPLAEEPADHPAIEAKAPDDLERKPARPRPRAKRKQAAEKSPEEPRQPGIPFPFMHMSEAEFARVLDFYGIEWHYEPRSFPLRWESGKVAEAFTPDFYLPAFNMYVELTTLKSGLRGEKNRKLRMLREIYPDVNIKLMHKAELFRFLTKYGYGPLGPDEVPGVSRILIPTTKLQQRVSELGVEISRDYADKEPVLVGVLRGVVCFIGDLIRQISVPVGLDFLAISSYADSDDGAVKILKDLESNIKGRHVILVEDIVDTGMTLNLIKEHLLTKKPASLKICALLDKRARRLADVKIDYVGFEIADEFVVGYGLDFRQRYRNLPFVAVLQHELLP